MNSPAATIRSVYEAFGRGDLPALFEHVADDVEWTFRGDAGAAYTGTVRGKEALAQWFGQVASADDIRAFEPRQMLAGPDHVTVIGHETTVARSSGRSFDADWVHVWQLDTRGRVARFWGLLDSEAAARAR